MTPPQPRRSYRILSAILRIFKKKPTIINLNETIKDQAIFVSNHSAASGPLTLSLYLPKLFVPWGIHDMCEGYATRWRYLYHVFYQQKLGFTKVRSFFIATGFALISKILYRAMQVIPTYVDMRLMETIRLSSEVIDSQTPILVFPEDSSDGYHEILRFYNPGFVYFSMQYHRKNEVDLPIYSVYYSKKDKAMIIDRPMYVQPLLAQGRTKEEIAELFKERANSLREELLLHLQQNG